MKSDRNTMWIVAFWISATIAQWLLFGWEWVSLFLVDDLGDVALPLALPAVVLGVTWRWCEGGREPEERLHAGQIAVWWAFAAWSEVLLLRLGAWLDGRIPALSTEGGVMLLLFLLVIFVWIPARMIKVTWVWARGAGSAPKPW